MEIMNPGIVAGQPPCSNDTTVGINASMNQCPMHPKVRPELPELLPNIAKLPVDERGYPDRRRCWRWSGTHRLHDGRPIIGKRYVYRVMHEYLIGPLPKGKGNASHHTCNNSWCINPWHLQPMPQSEHMQTHGLGGDWGQVLKTACPAGHLYDEANTYLWRGERQCRTCRRERMRQRRANAV